MGLTCIKIAVDIEHGLVFLSTVRRLNGKTSNALMNFKEDITEKEDGFN